MPFLAKLDLDGDGDSRRSRRLLANRLDALLIGNDRRFDIIIHNMSETGFLAEFSSDLKPGDIVGLQLARIGFVQARVVRKLGLGHGCEFLEPVSAEIVEETIGGSVRFAASTGRTSKPGASPEEAEREGYRRRVRRERAGAYIILTCLVLAALTLATALLWVYHS